MVTNAENLNKQITKKEEELYSQDDFAETPPSDIVAFNELRSCADLVRMYKEGQLDIQPDFQRDVVWPKASQTRFIDSLVKQLPIPSMCLSFDYITQKRVMIDGLQRISSIIWFLTKPKQKLSKLEDIDQRISGKSPEEIKEKDCEIYKRLENLTIPVTVLRCDYSKKSHMHYLFTIFHRLNTGGNKLSNQEIRNCIFQGKLNDLLKELVEYENFRKLLALEEKKSYRFSYEELILRFLAFHETYATYKGRLAKFLNDYMDDNNLLVEEDISNKRQLFERVIDLIYKRLMVKKHLPKLSKATIEAMLVGVGKNIDTLEDDDDEGLKIRFENLRKHEAFSPQSLVGGLSHKDKVKGRMKSAISVFS